MIFLSVDRKLPLSLPRQIVEALRKPILEGRLPVGKKLPSTRELAAQLGVSRNVIVEAYEMLLYEGFLEGKSGSGTFVAEGARLHGEHGGNTGVRLHEDQEGNASPAGGFKSSGLAGLAGLAEPVHPGYPCDPELRGNLIASPDKEEPSDSDVIRFRTGLPALDHFPRHKWGDALRAVYRDMPERLLAYGEPAGTPKLRSSLSSYLYRMRGVQANPEQIVVTTGAVQALQLAARVLLAPGRDMIVEDPSNEDLHRLLASFGARLLPVPVDEAGLCTSLLPEEANPVCIYVTPSHQFPYGGYLPIQRRTRLLSYARAKNCFILEDDYDSEFRYEGASIHSLHSLDPERVIYIGTFSKVLSPSQRIGYLVLPPALVEEVKALKRLADYQSPVAEQLALRRFIDSGEMDAHIVRMKKIYRKRQTALLKALEECFPGAHRVYGASTGLHVAVAFDFTVTEEMLGRLASCKVSLTPVQTHAVGPFASPEHVLFGFGHLSEDQIAEGVRRVKRAFLPD